MVPYVTVRSSKVEIESAKEFVEESDLLAELRFGGNFFQCLPQALSVFGSKTHDYEQKLFPTRRVSLSECPEAVRLDASNMTRVWYLWFWKQHGAASSSGQ